MANLRTKAKWIVPPPLGAAVGWATGATADAPPPVAWTIAGIADWLSVPFHWAFVIIGAVSGITAFIGLQNFIHPPAPTPPPPPPSDPKLGELADEIKALRLQLLTQNPAGAQQIEGFVATATELAESPKAEDRAIAQEAVEGDPLEAYRQLLARVEVDVTYAAERARQAARIAAPFSIADAITAYTRAVYLDPGDFNTWIELTRLHRAAGSLPNARRVAEAALQHVRDDWDRMVAENELGDIAFAEGQLPVARHHYQSGLNAAQAVLAKAPDDHDRLRELSVSHNKLGDVARAAGDLAAARESYAASLAIRERLAESDPGNAEWQRDLFISHAKLAQLAEAMDDSAGAIAEFEAGEAILVALIARVGDHPGFTRDLAQVRLDIARLRGGGG